MSLNSAEGRGSSRAKTELGSHASQGTVRVYALNYATLANFEMRELRALDPRKYLTLTSFTVRTENGRRIRIKKV